MDKNLVKVFKNVYDNSVSIFTSSGEDPVGIYIENSDISKTIKIIFKLMYGK